MTTSIDGDKRRCKFSAFFVLFLSAAPTFVSAFGAAREGETWSSADDCYDGGSCLRT